MDGGGSRLGLNRDAGAKGAGAKGWGPESGYKCGIPELRTPRDRREGSKAIVSDVRDSDFRISPICSVDLPP